MGYLGVFLVGVASGLLTAFLVWVFWPRTDAPEDEWI